MYIYIFVCVYMQRKRSSVAVGGSSLSVFEEGDGCDASSAVLDFCGVSAAQQVLVGLQPRKDRKTDKAARGIKRQTKFSSLPLDDSGKIIIPEDEEEEDEEKQQNECKKLSTCCCCSCCCCCCPCCCYSSAAAAAVLAAAAAVLAAAAAVLAAVAAAPSSYAIIATSCRC